MGKLVVFLLLLAAAGRADLVVRPVAGEGDPWRVQVEGHRVSAHQAFSAIADHLEWTVHWSPQDQEELKDHFLTIEIPDRHARTVLELIAASVGKEVDLEPDLRAILVFSEASPQTRSGRGALRERAVRSYREAMLDPANQTDPLDIKSRLADLFMKEEDFVAAAKEWQEIAENREGRQASGDLYPRACLGAGTCLEKAGRPADARQYYLRVIRDFRESDHFVQALLGNGRCLFASGRASEGVEGLERYLSNERYYRAYIGQRHESVLRLTLARGHFLAGGFRECLETLSPVLEDPDLSTPDQRSARLHAGLAALEVGEPDRAARWLGAYLAGTPARERTAEAWLGLAEALSSTGRQVEALAALAELDPAGLPGPTRRRLALARSRVELGLGRPARAAEALDDALKAGGGPAADPHLALALAQVRQEAGELEEARRLYQALLGRPEHAPPDRTAEAALDEARIGLVASLARQGYHEDALAAAREHLPRAVTDAARTALYQALIDALARTGRLEDAAREVLP